MILQNSAVTTTCGREPSMASVCVYVFGESSLERSKMGPDRDLRDKRKPISEAHSFLFQKSYASLVAKLVKLDPTITFVLQSDVHSCDGKYVILLMISDY